MRAERRYARVEPEACGTRCPTSNEIIRSWGTKNPMVLAIRSRVGLGLIVFRVRRPIAMIAAGFVSTALAGPASANVLIHVDKTTQHMTVSEDGVPLYSWLVSTGRRGYATPSGSFQPFRMDADHRSVEWDNAPMPDSIFFTREGHAIHGSFETRHFGTPVSHGCVRLSPQHAAILFALVKREGMANTQVVISGEAPAETTVARRQNADPADGLGEPDPRQSNAADLGADDDTSERTLVLPWYGSVRLDPDPLSPIH
jgi:lipoprotein-anchoring transpeptidase ErfK/SrfK